MAAPNDKLVIKASNAIVTLEVYSGQPNPSWPLSKEMAAEMVRRLLLLEASNVGTAESDSLGYRAVRAELHDEKQLTAVLSASRGVVTVEKDGERFQYRDVARQFELWLVNTAADHISADLFRYVTGEIAKK